MIPIEYPKIETLYDRDANFKVDTNVLRMPEFGLINQWFFTEKVDGSNVRICLHPDGSTEWSGRSDDSQFGANIRNYMDHVVCPKVFDAINLAEDGQYPETVIFGEVYGAGIQKGGRYRPDVRVRLFDVYIDGWWLEPEKVMEVADNMRLLTVPYIGYLSELPKSKEDLDELIPHSVVAIHESGQVYKAEGIVARTRPLLFNRKGERLMWKLKYKDFK